VAKAEINNPAAIAAANRRVAQNQAWKRSFFSAAF